MLYPPGFSGSECGVGSGDRDVGGTAGGSPVLDGRPGVPAAAHVDHEQGEEEEKGCCGEGHAVDSAVAEQGATVQVALQEDHPVPLGTPPGQLWRHREQLDGPSPPWA